MDKLPEDCICRIFAFTSPKDVCRFAAVSSPIRSAADSNLLWNTFLPADLEDIIAQSTSSDLCSSLNSLSKKALYLHLSDHPLVTGTGNSSFGLDKESGSICHMIGVKDIKAMNVRGVLEYISDESRFSEVAMMEYDQGVAFEGRIEVKNLTPETKFSVYLLFQTREDSLKNNRVASLTMEEGKSIRVGESIRQRKREDGWMELRMGGFRIRRDHASIHFFVGENTYPPPPGWFTIQGIEIRRN